MQITPMTHELRSQLLDDLADRSRIPRDQMRTDVAGLLAAAAREDGADWMAHSGGGEVTVHVLDGRWRGIYRGGAEIAHGEA